MREQCKDACLKNLAHHKRCIILDCHLLTPQEIDDLKVLYDAYYDAAVALISSK